MKTTELKNVRQYMGRLAPGKDLYHSLTSLCEHLGVTLGHIQGIGAAKKAVIGYFDDDAGKYIEIRFDHQTEIVALNANVSLKDGKSFVHAHITLGDRDGRLYGGHLLPGTEIFVLEYVLTTGEGLLERHHVDDLNLDLWDV